MEPFSRNELVEALRPLIGEADAIELMEGAHAIGQSAWARARANGCPAGERAFLQLAAMNLSEDTLIFLALASGKGAKTLSAFRQWRQRVSSASIEQREQDDARWNARYAQLAEPRLNEHP